MKQCATSFEVATARGGFPLEGARVIDVRRIHREMPSVMEQIHGLKFDYTDGKGMDFEPYAQVLSEKETRNCIRTWTGNASLDGAEYLMFGMDGTGGHAAFWCIRPSVRVLDQPIIFLGSENQLGVVANDFGDYLWLLAGGFGPYESLSYPDEDRPAHPEFTRFAIEHAPANRRSPAEILARARSSFPEFEGSIQSLCR